MPALDPRCTQSNGLNLDIMYEYDPNNNLTHQYNPENNHVEFTYDALNRKTRHIQHKPAGALVTRFTIYDEEDNLKEKVDPKNQIFTFDHDRLNRQTDAWLPTTDSPYLETTHVGTEYDSNNNVTKITETKTGDEPLTDVTTNIHDNHDCLVSTTQRGMTMKGR